MKVKVKVGVKVINYDKISKRYMETWDDICSIELGKADFSNNLNQVFIVYSPHFMANTLMK